MAHLTADAGSERRVPDVQKRSRELGTGRGREGSVKRAVDENIPVGGGGGVQMAV